MKTIGLIGGLSWESSLEYYRVINETVKERVGGLHSAQCVMVSVDFAPVERALVRGDWTLLTASMIDAAQKLKAAGADFIVICTNTMHRVADTVQEAVQLPVLHIVDAVAEQIQAKGLQKVGLLGTKVTMEENFYKERLERRYHIQVVIPDQAAREMVNRVIYEELCLGIQNPVSKQQFQKLITRLHTQGVQGIILGCTEIPLLIGSKDTDTFLFDSLRIHAAAAVEFALQ